jgi:hypothetical protein
LFSVSKSAPGRPEAFGRVVESFGVGVTQGKYLIAAFAVATSTTIATPIFANIATSAAATVND